MQINNLENPKSEELPERLSMQHYTQLYLEYEE